MGVGGPISLRLSAHGVTNVASRSRACEPTNRHVAPKRRLSLALCPDRDHGVAARPRPLLRCSPCRAVTTLASPALTRGAAARPLVLPRGYLGARGGPTSGRSISRAAPVPSAAKRGRGEVAVEEEDGSRALFQAALWGAEAAYILWLFLLPYAPGDPVWAISQATISDLIGLSLNFFFVLPLLNSDAGFGGIAERWQFAQSYLFSERLAYAFIWDILLYSIFQPWLIGDNIRNVKADATGFVNAVRFVPVVGLVAYLFCLEEQD
ncbi:hypothetical protein PR202_ga20057 [Eleusine coracana subsp. coracana]|uniref:Uncharacterized protein n=1 Tax=Eleusine coracana subsp. coracana TaxID=191504 RepID=A0AAV5CWF2_ELECO|nr:hypothetical protein PR202_ga20057 [Eleusine coracana subsp. coracana]